MEKLKSWRWSRLGNALAWEKALKNYKLWSVFACAIIVWVLLNIRFQDFLGNIIIGALCALFLYLFIRQCCCADDYFEIKNQEKPMRVYVYNKYVKNGNEQEIFIWQGNCVMRILAEGYCIKAWKDFAALLFSYENKQEWYYLASFSQEPIYLGKKVSETVFLVDEAPLRELKVLHERGIKRLEVDSFALKKIYPKSNSVQSVSSKSEVGNKLGEPNEYLTINRNSTYEMYALYYGQQQDMPKCIKMLPKISDQSGQKKMFILEDDDENVEIAWE